MSLKWTVPAIYQTNENIVILSSYFAFRSKECRSAQVPFSHVFVHLVLHITIKNGTEQACA